MKNNAKASPRISRISQIPHYWISEISEIWREMRARYFDMTGE